MPVPVSIVIPTRNEEAQIAECVMDLAWADEVLVADGGSSDATAAVAREAGAFVLENAGATIAAQRNAAIERARNSWVFALDADERFTETLREEVALTIAAPRHDAYRVRRRNFYLGRELSRGHWGHDWVTRLFPRNRRFVNRRVHEHLEPLPNVGWLNAPLLHIPYRDLQHQLEKMNRFALWGAEELYEQGQRANAWGLLTRPVGRFLKAYLLQGAIADGLPGLVSSMLGGYTAFLKQAHLWSLEAARGTDARSTSPHL